MAAVKDEETQAAKARNIPPEDGGGATIIDEPVVAKIAGIAAREVAGVSDMGSTFRRILARAHPGESTTQGVSVEVGTKEAAVDLALVIEYGLHLPTVAEEIRANVTRRLEEMTHLKVKEVNIEVTDVSVEKSPAAGSRVA